VQQAFCDGFLAEAPSDLVKIPHLQTPSDQGPLCEIPTQQQPIFACLQNLLKVGFGEELIYEIAEK
jgi:hypothetical protein